MNGLYLQYEKLCKAGKMGSRRMYFASLTEVISDLWFYETILGILKPVHSGAQGGNTHQGKRKLLFEIKKRKVKN